jgi:hypothetical protein
MPCDLWPGEKREVRGVRKYTRLPDGTCWARSGTQIGRDLTYGKPDLLAAAAMAASYEALIWKPEKRRNEIIRQLRADALGEDENGDPKGRAVRG